MHCMLVGVGGFGSVHLAALLRHGPATVTAVVDSDPAVLESLPGRFGIDPRICFPSVDRALEALTPDAAIVAVPNPARLPVVERLLGDRVACLVEKPLAHGAEQALRIAKSVYSTGSSAPAMLMVSQNYRFLKRARYIRDLIRDGTLGRLSSIALYFCRREPFLANGFYADLTGATVIAVELGCHHLDLLRYFVGAHPITVVGSTWHASSDLIQAHCHLASILTYPGDIHVSYSSSLMGGANRTEWPGRFEIELEKGHIVWDDLADQPLCVYGRSKGETRPVDVPELPGYPEDSVKRSQEAFFAAVSGEVSEEAAGCMFDANVRCLLTGLAIAESSEIGRPVDFEDFMQQRYSVDPAAEE